MKNTKKSFSPGTVARTNRSNKKFILDTHVKAELAQETDKGKVYRVTHLVMGGGEFDSPWIYESDQEGETELPKASAPRRKHHNPSGIVGYKTDARGNRRPVMRDRRGRTVVHQWHGQIN